MMEPIELFKIIYTVFNDYDVVLCLDQEYYTLFLGGSKPLTVQGDQSDNRGKEIFWSELPKEYKEYVLKFIETKKFAEKNNN